MRNFITYSSQNIIRITKSRRMRWARHIARMGEKRSAYKVLMGEPEGNRPLRRNRRRWKDSIKMYLKEIGNMDWINVAQDGDKWRALLNTVMNLLAP
jgi:hypothetical protein